MLRTPLWMPRSIAFRQPLVMPLASLLVTMSAMISILCCWLIVEPCPLPAQELQQTLKQDPKPLKTCSELIQPYKYPVKYQRLSNGATVAFVDEGASNEAVLMVHGLASYLPAWNKTIDDLKKNYRCIALDLPGYGRSITNSAVGIKAYADALAEFMDSLKLQTVYLMGHSLGGQVVLRAALRHPKKFKRLVLVAPAGIEQFDERQREFINDRYTMKYSKNKSDGVVQSDYERGFFKFPAEAGFMIQDRLAMRSASDFEKYCQVLADCVHASVNEPVIAELKNVRQPTLIIYGTEDNMIPSSLMHPEISTEEIGKTAAKSIKNSKLVMLTDCGHFAQFDCADATNSAIREFLKK